MPNIQSLTSDVQNLQTATDFWTSITLWLTAATAIVAVLYFVSSRIAISKAGHLRSAQEMLANAKQEQLARDLAAKDVEIAHAKDDAAKADQKAANANLLALQLREKLADRRLDPQQQKIIAGKLRPFAGQVVNFVAYPSDGEIAGILNDILEALGGKDGAGWKPSVFIGQEGNRAVRGIAVEIRANSNSDAAARAFVEALRSERIDIADPIPMDNTGSFFGSGVRDRNSPLRITIGKKP
jgi:outer membrane murein-binding lipoprotein Lpp